jgi:hypothetical protein
MTSLFRSLVFLIPLLWLGMAASQAGAATPPTLGTVAIYQLQDTSAYLQLSSFTSGSASATVTFEYGTDTTYGSQLAMAGPYGANTTFYAVGGRVTSLSSATTYHYRVKVTDTSGSVFSADQTFTTTAPPVLTTGTILAVGYSAANLSGSVDPKGHDLIMSYQINLFSDYRSGGGGNGATPSMVSGSGVTPLTCTLNGVSGNVYHYRLCAQDQTTGSYYYGADQMITFPSGDATTLAATNVADITAKVSGSYGSDPCIFSFQYGTDTNYGSTQLTVSLQSNAISPSPVVATGILTGLQPNTLYHYRVVAYVPSKSQTYYGADMTLTTAAPSAPPSFTWLNGSLTDLAATGTLLTAVLQTGSSPATLVFDYGTDTSYGTTVAYPGTLPASTSPSQGVHITGLTPGTLYHFRARATNSEGSATSADATFTTLQVPTATTGAATSVGGYAAGLNGSYVRQNGIYTASFEYGLTTAYGSSAPSTNLVIIAIGSNNPLDAATTIATLSPSTTYHYRLKLVDSTGTAYYGNDVTFTTLSSSDSWRQTYFQSTENTGSAADLANPAGDGLPNLLKYALGLDPTVRSVLPAPSCQSYNGGGTRLSLSFTRLAYPPDVTLEVQTADSLSGPWTTIASSSNGGAFAAAASIDAGIVQEVVYPSSARDVLVYDTVPMAQATRRFMRLKVFR